MQQSLAEYKFIYCRVPGIASNILRNVLLQFTRIFYLHLHSYSLLAETSLSTWNRISPPLIFHNPLYRQLSVLEDTVFIFLFLNRWAATKRAWIQGLRNRGKFADIHTNLDTYLNLKISNEAGFGYRQPRLVTHATWISLLHSHQALQQQY